jgi:hypothetical protein
VVTHDSASQPRCGTTVICPACSLYKLSPAQRSPEQKHKTQSGKGWAARDHVLRLVLYRLEGDVACLASHSDGIADEEASRSS